MEIQIGLTERELRDLIYKHLQERLGGLPIKMEHINIQVKSKQNYKSEWEEASFRATYHQIT